MVKKVALVTGGFDPLHSGHIDYFRSAKREGDILVVGLNSDEWLRRKKGKNFLNYKERSVIVEALSMVDDVIKYNDHDDTAIDAILKTQNNYPNSLIIFCNGGDRVEANIPENKFFTNNKDIIFKFNIGGSKTNSSSKILDRWRTIDKHKDG